MVKTIEFRNKPIRIDGESRVPKYRQIINSIIEDIDRGILRVGERVPSINEISEEYYLSRDTVEKAYNELKKKQIIVSSKGKGYYVARASVSRRINILFLVNKLSSYKLDIYNAFVSALRTSAHVDLCVYHYDPKLFTQSLEESVGRYDYYVVMPHFKDAQMMYRDAPFEVIEALEKIPGSKLMFIDNLVAGIDAEIPAVYQDFKTDLYEALQDGLFRLKRYNKIILVFPQSTVYPFPPAICSGFHEFCETFGFDQEVIDQIYPDMDLCPGDAYVVIEENDLVKLVKQMREKKMTPGSEIGIVSYNDTPLKELLGITVISTDFRVMGETAAYMMTTGKREIVKNVFSFIDRNSV
ncbi:MAG TPA: GntR family transcriptional regulator [Chryseosolibacter sp.]|nr:GntR family transcriptional regulator [Chryseosolibacter sp.]